jgi:hypothetical protein
MWEVPAMAINIVSLVTQFLTPDMIGRIASSIGIDRNTAERAVGAAIPALLAGLTKIAARPDGARQLSNVLAQQPAGALDNLRNAIGGSGDVAVAESGSSLASLLGGGTMGAIAGAIGRFAGLGDGASKSLLGLVGGAVIGSLAKAQRSEGLDANGLAAMLTSQKDRIASAMPSGLANHLSGTGVMDALEGGVRGGVEAASSAASKAAGAAQSAAASANRAAQAARSAGAKWLYWLVGLIIVAGLAWYFVGTRDAERLAEQARQTAGQAVPSLNVGGVDLANQFGTSLDAVKSALGGITDSASAQAALPKLRDATAQFEKMGALAAQLPAEGKKRFAGMVASAMPAINSLCDKVLANGDVAGVARPAINELRARLDTLSRA